jgi:hypothetical protein
MTAPFQLISLSDGAALDKAHDIGLGHDYQISPSRDLSARPLSSS